MTETVETEPAHKPAAPGRRRMLTGMAVGGAAIAGGVIGASATAASASGYRRAELVLDVACIGPTWREAVSANAADDADFRAPFMVEGFIYPEGTIAGDGFIPKESGSIGRWFCRGYVAIDSTRPEPHTVSHQDYILGSIVPESLFPTVMLSSCGLEGSEDKSQFSTRAVIGGTGEYLGATGQVTQHLISDNTSLFPFDQSRSPNFRFQFELRVPD